MSGDLTDFSAISNDMPDDLGPDGLLATAAVVLFSAIAVGSIAVACWACGGFEAPISQAPVARATR